MRSKTEFYNDAGHIVDLLCKLSSTNILENKRTRDHSEARSVLYTIFRSKYNVSLKAIEKYMEDNGKSSDHSTIIHSLNSFEIYVRYSKYLKDWLDTIIYKIDTNTLR